MKKNIDLYSPITLVCIQLRKSSQQPVASWIFFGVGWSFDIYYSYVDMMMPPASIDKLDSGFFCIQPVVCPTTHNSIHAANGLIHYIMMYRWITWIVSWRHIRERLSAGGRYRKVGRHCGPARQSSGGRDPAVASRSRTLLQVDLLHRDLYRMNCTLCSWLRELPSNLFFWRVEYQSWRRIPSVGRTNL